MKIAIPHENGRLHGHFGGCREFAVFEVDQDTRTTVDRQIIPAPEHQPGLFPRWLQAQGVAVIIVGGIGQRALALFAQQGIEVRPGQPGALVEGLIANYLGGMLTGTPEGCTNHSHHDDHPHPHSHPHLHHEHHPFHANHGIH